MLFALPGCVSGVSNYAARQGMTVTEVDGTNFTHLAVQRPSASASGRLHVYIEGDGIPWIGTRSSADPTPRNTLTLRLAASDAGNVLYLGRPCYFKAAKNEECHPRYWTSHRYSAEIVDSMAAAIVNSRQDAYSEIVLIGYSGGGVLAALLESEVPGVVAVVTVAANLDVGAWAEHHGYDPLTGSLDPIKTPKTSAIRHFQYVGGRDAVVPPELSVGYAASHPGVELIEVPEFDHKCCWEEIWPAVLDRLEADLAIATTHSESR